MSRIGILGGTFNPIHNGHIELALYSMREVQLDKVLIVPDNMPPHKSDSGLVSSCHRLRMCELAIEELEHFEVSGIELERGGRSYTYETLSSLKEIYPCDELFFITGADMFLTLHSWRKPEVVFQTASIISAPRNEADKAQLEAYYHQEIQPMGAKAVILDNPVMQVSSTLIRDNIENSELMNELLNPNVYQYIEQNTLYRK